MLEICVDSFESLEAAVKGGAYRIELCSSLSEGGLTPSVGLLKTAKVHFPDTKIYCMIRPHSRISYKLSQPEMECINHDMKLLRENGADGFVFGSLSTDRSIDMNNCQQVIENARTLPVTFHRAFDMTIPTTKDENIAKIVDLGFKRLLTSGFCETAEQGLKELCEIQNYINKEQLDLTLMPGSGVSIKNAANILQATGCKEFHASAKRSHIEHIPHDDGDTSFITTSIYANSSILTEEETVRSLVSIGKQFR